jgi:hypothetical protein
MKFNFIKFSPREFGGGKIEQLRLGIDTFDWIFYQEKLFNSVREIYVKKKCCRLMTAKKSIWD